LVWKRHWRRGGKIGILERGTFVIAASGLLGAGRDTGTDTDGFRKARRMTASWKDVRRARIPVGDLPVLAELRGRGSVRVLIAGAAAWVSWEPGPGPTQEMLVRRILPLPGAVLYTERGGSWYQLAEHLPCFHVPKGDGSDWPSLERTIVPEAVVAARDRGRSHDPIRLRLVRDPAMPARPASALRCAPEALAAWAERATSAELAAVKGAWKRPVAPGGSNAVVLVTGPIGSLPPLEEGVRFWGTELLIPLGYRALPNLPPSAIRRAAGATIEELALLEEDGLELIPKAIFNPISRAAVRLLREPDGTLKEPSR
jgi:MoxR-vWA-beta-propeller ternary system domain bpX2